MGFFEKVKVKAEELLGRAEQVYGESHGDAAATVRPAPADARCARNR